MDRRQFEKIRSVFDRSGIALTLSDLTRPDQPLVLANPKFLSMTGYPEAEILGRNCRFLQRDGDNLEERAEIRQAMAAGREVQAVLRNFRRDGSEFNNLLFLHPIGPPGAPTHYLGSQFILRMAWGSEPQAMTHVDTLLHDMTRIGVQAERLEMEQRRHLAEATAVLIRAWERRR